MFRQMEKRKEKSDQNAVAELTREWLYKENKWLWEENRKLKEDLENMRDYCSNLDSENDEQALEIEDLKREIEKLKETIKDHQLYEEKLEHRIIEFEELLHWE